MFIKNTLVILIVILLFPSLVYCQPEVKYTISWDSIVDPAVTTVLIYRSLVDDDNYFDCIDSVSASTTNYIDTNVEYNRRYFYRLRAKDNLGNLSPFSGTVSGLTMDNSASYDLRQLCRIVSTTVRDTTSCTVRWETNELTRGKLRYWKIGDTNYLETLESESYTTSHEENLVDLEPNASYFIVAVAHDANGNLTISAPATVSLSSHEEEISLPKLKVYPVPFRPDESILTFENLPNAGNLIIYDIRGRKVWQGNWQGTNVFHWDGRNNRGIVGSGRYFIVITDDSGKVVDKRAIIVLR